MNKQDIYNYLKENNIWHEITEHKAVYNMAELAEVDTPYPENLMDIMGLIPGAVTPLGILNDTEKKVHFYLDKHFLEEPGLVGVHPNDNTATVWLKTEDLIRIIEEHEHDVTLVSLD